MAAVATYISNTYITDAPTGVSYHACEKAGAWGAVTTPQHERDLLPVITTDFKTARLDGSAGTLGQE